MAVNTTEIDTVFTSMMGSVKNRLDVYYDETIIDSEVYAKVLAGIMQSTLQLATQTVQQQPVLDSQVDKTAADTAFVDTQKAELTASVGFNNKIKALDSYSDMIGTMGAGSLVVSSDMWSKYFSMVQDLNNAGSLPTNTVIDKLT